MNKFFFIIKNRKNNTKISFFSYIKAFENIKIGKFCQINSHSSLDATKGKIIIKDHVILNRYSYLNAFKGSIFIDEGSEINNFASIYGIGGVKIGKNVLIGPGVKIISYQHNYIKKDLIIKSQGLKKEKIVIKDDVWIGANSVILSGVTLKKGSVIGAGSVVTKNTDEYGVYVGIPAKLLKYRN